MRTILLLALMAPVCGAQTIEVESLFQPAPLAGPWKHHPGDDPRWADPAFDEHADILLPRFHLLPAWVAKLARGGSHAVRSPRDRGLPLGGFCHLRSHILLTNQCDGHPGFIGALDHRATVRVRNDDCDEPAVLVGDVSGKGLKAAMLVSVTVGMLRRERSSSPAEILAGLNEGLVGRCGGGFVTCCCAHFDADGTVTIANAGHPSPYIDGREVEVEAGLPLGIAPGMEYAELVTRGEQFTLVSDGVVEAENASASCSGSSVRARSRRSLHRRLPRRRRPGGRTMTSP